MKNITRTIKALCLGLCASAAPLLHGAELKQLWQVGLPDRNNAEFALAPGDYRQFKDDGFFVVGRSEAKKDWPYVHPGPGDSWAGGRSHTFMVVFGLKKPPGEGRCRLLVELLDTQKPSPPRLRIAVNGRATEKRLSAGAGDESVFGNPAKGRKQVWEVPVPAQQLHEGNNEIEITTLSGSWMLYDSVRFETPAGFELADVASGTQLAAVRVPPVWVKDGSKAAQPLTLTLRHIGSDTPATVFLGDSVLDRITLKNGLQTIDLKALVSEERREVTLRIRAGNSVSASTNLTLAPPRIRELWILPHSHVDIGYTHRQDDIIKAQISNLEVAMRLAKASATNPPGMRYKWNPEAVWTLDHFLRRADKERTEAFLQAVRDGEVGVDGLFGNMLTGLCRPEELAQCLSFGARIGNLTGVPVESAAICDVPGWTWGMVPIMAQAGVKYFAIGPNFGDRVGTVHVWDDKPFYWTSQSGRDRVLCWVVDNYHHLGNLDEHVLGQVERLDKIGFPFDTSFLFWVGQWPNGGVDNAPPDEKTVDKVVAWNAKYAAPRLTIGLAGEFFRSFERQHGSRLPKFSGDITPYWEDGAGSTSRETGLNRASADRLSMAETLFALRARAASPGASFDAAWKNVLLYSEHTWGAWNSISEPDNPFVLDQWKVKQSFALEADRQSRALLAAALPKPAGPASALDVFNTTQWPRTDLAVVPKAVAGESVLDDQGNPVPAQRLASGELVFLAGGVPAYGAKRFRVAASAPSSRGSARAEGRFLRTDRLTVEVDETSGAIKSLRLAGLDHEFVDAKAPVGLNDYRYVLGTNARGAQPNGPATVKVLEAGPLVAALRIESEAPGCNKLVREVRVIDSLDRVEVINHVDRKTVREKDSVHFGYGFQVPDGKIHMETPWAVVRPNLDQLPGSCRNWFTVQRWVDISNPDCGVTWAPLEAPLMQIGGITANLLGSVAFRMWMTNALDSQTIYSWAQNNHWHTNYKIDQPGVTTFRFFVRPHRQGYAALEAARFGIETSRPLVAAATDPGQPAIGPLLSVSPSEVLVETVKVSSDAKALIVRLFGVSGKAANVKLDWPGVKPASVWRTDLSEKPLQKVDDSIEVPPYGVVFLRAEI